MPSEKNRISLQMARDRLAYDPETGRFMWLPRTDNRRDADRWNRQFAGKEAGSVNMYGYRRVCVEYITVQAHRLAWLFIHGEWPEHEVDHKDRNRDNNSADNLRAATRTQNGGNKSMHRNNTSGKKGVSWHKRIGKWSANIRVNDRLKNLGYFDDLEEASSAYRKAAVEAFGDYATDGEAA